MPDEKPKDELARLKNEQEKARREEVFGGLSASEKQQYETRRKRILILQADARIPPDSAGARQQRAWEQTSETDSPQEQARQPYRSREEDSSQAYADSEAESREVRRKTKNE